MTLRIERAALLSALGAVTKVVETRNTYPILANVHLSVADDRLTIRGTDLDIEYTTSVAAEGDLPTTTAPAKMLHDIVRKFPAGAEVTLELADGQLLVKAGRSRFKLATLDPESFPTLNAGEYTATFSTDLAALFAPVAFAISNEETRYYLNGIFLHNPGGEMRAVATDGHRLARHAAATVGEIPAVIVPRKTVGLIPTGEVTVSLSSSKIRVEHGDSVLVSKLIEGSFPDYERVTPKNNEKTLAVDRAAMLAAVDRVSVIASERGGKAVRLEVGDGSLTLSAKGDNDAASEELAAEWDGNGDEAAFVIGFNAGYLSEVLRNVTGETVTFKLADPGAPAVIVGDNDNWLGVLMPLRVA